MLETREQLARLFGASSSRNVIFTPSVTYSLNYFIKGFLKPGDHVIVTGIEHNAVMRPLWQMKKQGVDFDVAATDREGTVSLESLEGLIREKYQSSDRLHASNVCGTVTPIQEIGEICRRHHIFFAVGQRPERGNSGYPDGGLGH